MAHVEDRWQKTVDGRTVKTARHGKGLRWRARYRDPSGRERSKTFAKRVEADRFLATVEGDKVRGAWIEPTLQRTTVRAWATEWQSTIVNLEPATIAWYDAKLRNHVLPEFGDMPVAAVGQLEIRRWVADMQTRQLGARTIRGAVVTLSQVLGVA